MTSPRKQHAASAAAAAAAASSQQQTAAASSSSAAAAAASSGTRSARGSPPAPAAPSSSQLLSPTTPFSSQSSLPATPSSQGGGSSSRAPHEGGGGGSSVDPSGFSNLQYLFGSVNSALWDEDDDDDDEFVPNPQDMADPDGLAGLEGIEEEMEGEGEEATPRDAAAGSRADSPASSQGGAGGGSQRVGRTSHIARRTRAHMPLHGVRLEDLETQLTSSVLDWDTAHARLSDMGSSSLFSPNPLANPLASPLPPRSPTMEAANNAATGLIDHSAAETPSLTPGGADQDREYQNFLRLLAGGDGGTKDSGDGAPDDDDDDDEEFQPGDAGMAEEEAEEEEYRTDRSVRISQKELRGLRNDSGKEPRAPPGLAAAAAASSSRVMSTRRKEQQQQQQAAASSSSAAAAAHHPQTRSGAAAHPSPPAPATRSRLKGSQQHQQPDFFASAHSSIPSQAALHTRRKPSQHDLQQSQSSAEQMEDTQQQPNQSDGSARSDLFLTVPTLPMLPNPSFNGFSDGNPLNASFDAATAAAAAAVPMMAPSTAAAGLAQLAPLLQMLQQSIAAITAAPAIAAAPVAPPPPKPAVLPRADFTDTQRHTLVSQLNEHVQLLVQVRYLSLNSVLTPVGRPPSVRKSKKTAAEDDVDDPTAAASADVDPPPMSLKQLWDKSGDLLSELWQKREASDKLHQSTSAASAPASVFLLDPFECPASSSSSSAGLNRPMLTLVPLLDTWKGLSEGPELQSTHAEMVRQQEKHIPEPIKRQANKSMDAAARARIRAEMEVADATTDAAVKGSRFDHAYNRHGWCYTPLLRRFLRADLAAPQIRPRLMPAIKMIYAKQLWTPAEDALLDRGYRAFGAPKVGPSGRAVGADWPRIKHRFLPGRTVSEIRTRFQNLRMSKVHPYTSATDSPFQKHLLRAELTEQEIEEQLAEDLMDDEEYAEKKMQEQDAKRAMLRHLREEQEEDKEPHPLQSTLHSSLFEEPEVEAPVAPAAAAAPSRRTLVSVAAATSAAAASPSATAASAFAPYLALLAPPPVPVGSSKRKSSAAASLAAAPSLPPMVAPAIPIWSTKAIGTPGVLMHELSEEDTKLLKAGLEYFPESCATRWSSIVAHFLPHWDRLSLRRAWLRMQRVEKLAAEGKTIAVHKARKLSKKQLAQMAHEAQLHAQLQANAQMSAVALAQYAAAVAPSSLFAAYQRKSLAAMPLSDDAAVIDMTVGVAANKRQKVAATNTAASLLAPVQALPVSNWNAAAMAAAASARNEHAAPSASYAAPSSAAAASSSEPVFEELDIELEEDDAAVAAQGAAHADATDEDEEVVEEESGVVAPAPKVSAQQVAAAALAASAADSSGVAPMQLDGDDTDSESNKPHLTAAAPAASAAAQATPAKSPSKRVLARSAADAIVALRAPDEAASSMPHPRAAVAAAAASPARSFAAGRSHSSPEKRSAPLSFGFVTPLQTPLLTPQKSGGLASLAHTSELIHTVPAPLLAPVDKQLQYSEESLAYASSTPLPLTSSPSKSSRSKHATPLVMVVTPAPAEEGPATRSLRRNRSPLVAASAAAAVAAATAAASASSSSFAPHQLLSSLSASASPTAFAAATAAGASRPPRAARALAQASLTAAASGRWGVGDRAKSNNSLLGLPQTTMHRAVSDPPPTSAASAAASFGSAASSASPATTVPSTPVVAASSSVSAEPASAAASSPVPPSWTEAEDRSILTAAKSFGLEVEAWPAEARQPLLRADGAAEQRRTDAQIKQRLMSFLTAMVQKLPDA